MKILVTGSAGFIGWKVSEKLLERGDFVVGVDNINDYYDIRLKNYRLNLLKKFDNFLFFKEDIENLEGLRKIFKNHKFDAVINLAARAGVRASIENPNVYYTTNVLGTLNLLELCRDFDVPKFVLASTSSLYAGHSLPFKEDMPVNNPISPYAASKKAAEVTAYTYHYLYGIDVSVLRYFTVYGPAGRPDMSIFRFIKWILEGKPVQIYGDGTQGRDFTYVDDIAEGTIKALKPLGYEIINLGGGKGPVSVNYIIELIERFTGKKAKVRHCEFNKVDIKSTWADIKKAKDVLKWSPTIDINVGLKSTVMWFSNNFDWITLLII